MELRALAEEIHDRSWAESPVKPIGRSFAVRYVEKLRPVDPVQFLAHCFRSFDRSYCVTLVLSLPELLEPLDVDAWAALVRALSPRPEPAMHSATGWYTDAILFIKWLDLDALAFVGSIADVPTADKLRLARYCAINASSLVMRDEEREDLDGNTLCTPDHLAACRAKLLSQNGRLRPPYSGEEELCVYAARLCKQLEETNGTSGMIENPLRTRRPGRF